MTAFPFPGGRMVTPFSSYIFWSGRYEDYLFVHQPQADKGLYGTASDPRCCSSDDVLDTEGPLGVKEHRESAHPGQFTEW